MNGLSGGLHRFTNSLRLALVATASATAGCSSVTEEPEAASSTTVSITGSSTVSITGSSTGSITGQDAGGGPTPSRVAANPGTDEYKYWIGRGVMTSSSVMLVWAEVEEADSYRIYRFERVPGFDPESVELSAGSLIFDGMGTDYVDEGVEEGLFYTYIFEPTIEGQFLPRRWTEALTVDDVEPPSPIRGLMAELTEDGVLLSWEPSSDNVEFASYAVTVLEDDQARYIGGGGDVQQTSFLDDQPLAGLNRYSVQATDFHDNRTEPAIIEIIVP